METGFPCNGAAAPGSSCASEFSPNWGNVPLRTFRFQSSRITDLSKPFCGVAWGDIECPASPRFELFPTFHYRQVSTVQPESTGDVLQWCGFGGFCVCAEFGQVVSQGHSRWTESHLLTEAGFSDPDFNIRSFPLITGAN